MLQGSPFRALIRSSIYFIWENSSYPPANRLLARLSNSQVSLKVCWCKQTVIIGTHSKFSTIVINYIDQIGPRALVVHEQND